VLSKTETVFSMSHECVDPANRPIDGLEYRKNIEEIVIGFIRVVRAKDAGEYHDSEPTIKIGTPPTYQRIGETLGTLAQIYAVKNPLYGSAWCKRGEHEIFHNVARKFDRMDEHITYKKKSPDLLRPDDVADLGNYGAMQLAYYLHHRVDQFRTWIRKLLHDGEGL